MAIGSVKELIDYERETIKIAQKHGGGGGSVDLSLIADKYDETHQYPANDMVVYDNKLYKSTTAVNTPGVFNETMWTEYLPYDPSNTYNTGDYATKTVEGDNRCFRCDEDNVTGEWDDTKWTDVSDLDFEIYNSNSTTPYYKNSSKVYQIFYPDMKFYYIANVNYEPTGGAGAWNSAKWTETTVEAVINDIKPKHIVLCNSNDITTDSKGYITNTLNLPNMFAIHLTEVFFTGSMIPGSESMYPYYVVNGGTLAGKSDKHYPVLRLYSKTTGEPVASMTAGTISDMSVLSAIYFND